MSDIVQPPSQELPVESTEVETSDNVETSESQQENSTETSSQKQEKKDEIKKQLKKLKLKVDGKEFEEEVNLDDDEYLTKQFQLAKAAQKRMSEKAELEKEIHHFLTELRKNPRKVLSDPNLGVDIKAIAAQIIEEEIANAQKSPEQLEKEKIEAELRALKEEREKEREESRVKELNRLQEQEFQRYDMLVSDALEKSDLPKTPFVVKKMADYMLLGLEKGLSLEPKDVIDLIRDDIQGDIKEMFSVMPLEVVEQIIGKEIIDKLRKKRVAAAKQTPPPPVNKSIVDTGEANKPKEEVKEKKKINYKDFFGV